MNQTIEMTIIKFDTIFNSLPHIAFSQTFDNYILYLKGCTINCVDRVIHMFDLR